MRLLDLFSCAGGAGMGYHRAGFEVVGVDIAPQPRYPFEFVQADALEYLAEHGHEFDAIHASPPCQAFTASKHMWKGKLPDDRHPDLVGVTRQALIESGRPYVIENVEGAPLLDPITLCGDMFGLRVKRHRIFETSWFIWGPPTCRPDHPDFELSVFGGTALTRTPEGGWTKGLGNFMQGRSHAKHSEAAAAMGIDWMTRGELSQAIPPAYTEWLGRELLAEVDR